MYNKKYREFSDKAGRLVTYVEKVKLSVVFAYCVIDSI